MFDRKSFFDRLGVVPFSDSVVVMSGASQVRQPWYDELFCGDVHLASYWWNRQYPDQKFEPVPLRFEQTMLPLA